MSVYTNDKGEKKIAGDENQAKRFEAAGWKLVEEKKEVKKKAK
jgi:transketolase